MHAGTAFLYDGQRCRIFLLVATSRSVCEDVGNSPEKFRSHHQLGSENDFVGSMAGYRLSSASMAVLAGTMGLASAIPALVSRQTSADPFAPIDPQNWVSNHLDASVHFYDLQLTSRLGEPRQYDLGTIRCTS